MFTATGNSNQMFEQDSIQEERPRSRVGAEVAGLAGFGALSNSLNDVANGMDSTGVTGSLSVQRDFSNRPNIGSKGVSSWIRQ